ncbi:transketolase [Candidatus Gottesmanbacteria bacterium]|nr:transketolase [Candidatus Gottesmanbacteria bacterium]
MILSERHLTDRLKKTAKEVRKDIIEMAYTAGVGHIGPALSIADILTVLVCKVVKRNKRVRLDPYRDRLLLSKGHAASALYALLHATGRISRKDLLSYCQNGGAFGDHPEYNPGIGIEFTAGSLGLGLSVGAGIAYSLKNYSHNKSRRSPMVYVILSDAELNEGSIWETVMFAGHHHISNLVAVVDANGQQAYGKTKDIINLDPIHTKWEAFGWKTYTINGHDIPQFYKTLRSLPTTNKRPQVIIAKTIAGYGVSFMHRKILWHYWPLDKKLYQKALADINRL